jgi:hypothetical protein
VIEQAPLPPLRRIDVALRAATAVLAQELVDPTSQSPAWDGFEWGIAKAVAVMQGIAPLLARGSRWSDRPRWQEFLGEQRRHVAVRQHRIEVLLAEIDAMARSHGVPLVPLKGAALHMLDIYEPGDRPMADIDLFVPLEAKAAAGTALGELGFEVTFENRRHQLFELRGPERRSVEFGEHADNPIKIELHTTIREHLPVEETDITGLIAPLQPQPGLNGYRSPVYLMMHLLLHTASNMRARALRLIQLHDIARLGSRFSSDDWHELLAARPSGRSAWWAAPPLLLAARNCGAGVPNSILAALEKDCSWPLRRVAPRQSVADVSWSNIQVHAFPGIEWSRSPVEAMQFMFRRLWPNGETRTELRHFAEHEQGKSTISWYGVSQRRRILRWVFSRPPRVQTLRVVQAALEQTG